jgi:uncharacterized protein YndB with AHSA1/START domain
VIRRQVVLPVGPDRLWEALTDPDQAERWLGGRVDWDVREGSPLSFTDEAGRPREGRVETVRPGRYLKYRWWTTPQQDEAPEESEVSYLLEPDGAGTRLTVQERSLPAQGAPEGLAPEASASVASDAWTPWDDRIAGAWVSLSAPLHASTRA